MADHRLPHLLTTLRNADLRRRAGHESGDGRRVWSDSPRLRWPSSSRAPGGGPSSCRAPSGRLCKPQSSCRRHELRLVCPDDAEARQNFAPPLRMQRPAIQPAVDAARTNHGLQRRLDLAAVLTRGWTLPNPQSPARRIFSEHQALLSES